MDGPAVGLDGHERADRVAVRPRADELEPNPAPGGRRVVAENCRRTVLVADDQVQIAVVVKVADGQAVADVIGLEVGACACVCEPEPLAREVSMQQGGLGVARRLTEKLGVVVDVAVGDHDIGPAVAVEIGQRTAPADPGKAVDGQAEDGGDIQKNARLAGS